MSCYGCQTGVDSLKASVKVSRCTRHDGFDEEGLLAVALLVASDDTEAPALIVGLLQDDVPAPVHWTGMTKTESEVSLVMSTGEVEEQNSG